MKKIKANSRLIRLIAFMLIATALLCIVGFSANGWQSMTDSESNSDKAVNNSGNVDDDKDTEPDPPTARYYDHLTGEEISEERALLKKAAFVISSDAPLYGASCGDLVIELPTEGAATRLLLYTDCINSIGKIGSVAPTRGYISSLTASFGGILISNGSDAEYGENDLPTDYFDLKANTGYSYTEYGSYVYSNNDLIKAGLINCGFSTYQSVLPSLPYNISVNGNINRGSISALGAVLKCSESSQSELTYSSELGGYVFSKNGSIKTDLLYDKELAYKNAFILFADSATYESESGAELVMNTCGGGRGYYLRDGFAEQISWKCGADGKITFTDKNNSKLTVGSGKTYIGFMKSSQSAEFISQ